MNTWFSSLLSSEASSVAQAPATPLPILGARGYS